MVDGEGNRTRRGQSPDSVCVMTSSRRRRRFAWSLGLVTAVLALVGCGSSGVKTGQSDSSAPRTSGPAATLRGPVSPGDGASFILDEAGHGLAAAGYTQTEFFASGVADSYRAVGPTGADGMWAVTAASSAPYRTRIVVREPADPSRFNGTVVVEWLNVSGGADLPADAIYLSPELERAGYAWVGVSAQKTGVDNLREKDPARYSSLSHPGDAFSYDIFSQTARALLTMDARGPLGSLHPRYLLAVGESQSAIYLTTYIDAVQPVAHVFDGFLVHSRAGGAIPIPGGTSDVSLMGGGIRIRSDIGVPVLIIATETDEAFGHYYDARQPDSRFVRLWDIAGASHADTYAYGGGAASLGCSSVNDAPSHFIIEAALSSVDTWLRSGTPPPSAPRLDVRTVGGAPTVQDDALGVAIGGIRGPWVAVPAATYSGHAPPGSQGWCFLFGSTRAFSSAQLAALYPSKSAYIHSYTEAADRAIEAGYLLAPDRAAVIAFAEQTGF
jgi:hypothetical protein